MCVCAFEITVSHCTPVTEESHLTQVHVSLELHGGLQSAGTHTREGADCSGVVVILLGVGGSV